MNIQSAMWASTSRQQMTGEPQQLPVDYSNLIPGYAMPIPMTNGGYQNQMQGQMMSMTMSNDTSQMYGHTMSIPNGGQYSGMPVPNPDFQPRVAMPIPNVNGQPSLNEKPVGKRRSPKLDSNHPLYKTSPLVRDNPASQNPYSPGFISQQGQPFNQQPIPIGVMGIAGPSHQANLNPNIPSFNGPSMAFTESSVFPSVSAVPVQIQTGPLNHIGYDNHHPPIYNATPIPYAYPEMNMRTEVHPQLGPTPKHTRKPFAASQSAYLRQCLAKNKNPTKEEQEEIAGVINDTYERVHNWFLNHKNKESKDDKKAKAKLAEEGAQTKQTPLKSQSRRNSKVSIDSGSGHGSGDMSRVQSTTESVSQPMSGSSSHGSGSILRATTTDGLQIGPDGSSLLVPTPGTIGGPIHPDILAQHQLQVQSHPMTGEHMAPPNVTTPAQFDFHLGTPVPQENFAFGTFHPTPPASLPKLAINTNLVPHVDRLTGLDDFAALHSPTHDHNDHFRRRSSVALGHLDPKRAGGPFSAMAMNSERSSPYPTTAVRRGSLLPPHPPIRSNSMLPMFPGRISEPPTSFSPSGSRRNSQQYMPSPSTPRTRNSSGQPMTPSSAVRSGGRRVSRMASTYDKSINMISDITLKEGATAPPTAIGVPIQATQIKAGFSFGTLPPVDPDPQHQSMGPPPISTGQDFTIEQLVLEDGTTIPWFDETRQSTQIAADGQGDMEVDEGSMTTTSEPTAMASTSCSSVDSGFGLGLDPTGQEGNDQDRDLHLLELTRSLFPEGGSNENDDTFDAWFNEKWLSGAGQDSEGTAPGEVAAK